VNIVDPPSSWVLRKRIGQIPEMENSDIQVLDLSHRLSNSSTNSLNSLRPFLKSTIFTA
jgi:hypothetical protein